MSVFKDFWNFIQNKLIGGGTVEISSEDLENLVDSDKLHELALYEFALNAGINIIANALSACEIRTFSRNKEVKGKEYYLWNYSPHVNMNANEFMHKIVWNLIYRNECLVIETPKGELLVADSYDHDTFALYPDVFRNVTVNATAENGVMHPFTFREEFRMDEVLFYRLSSKNITALLSYLMDGYNSLMQNAIDTFYRASGERGILTIDGNAAATQNYGTKPDGTPRTFQEVFTEMMNKQFKEYFKSSNAVMPVWKGFDYQVKGGAAQKRSTSEVKDITDLTTEIYTKVQRAPDPAPADPGDVSGRERPDQKPDDFRRETNRRDDRNREQPEEEWQGCSSRDVSDDRYVQNPIYRYIRCRKCRLQHAWSRCDRGRNQRADWQAAAYDGMVAEGPDFQKFHGAERCRRVKYI